MSPTYVITASRTHNVIKIPRSAKKRFLLVEYQILIVGLKLPLRRKASLGECLHISGERLICRDQGSNQIWNLVSPYNIISYQHYIDTVLNNVTVVTQPTKSHQFELRKQR